jgi:hypothetical protein
LVLVMCGCFQFKHSFKTYIQQTARTL